MQGEALKSPETTASLENEEEQRQVIENFFSSRKSRVSTAGQP